MDKERIVLGSGKLYITEYTGTIPSNEEIEKKENILGLIQGGATIDYTPTFYTAKDDLSLASITVLTDEVVKLVSGIMTWNAKTLQYLCATARITETDQKRTVKIGGLLQDNKKNYLLRFVHFDKKNGDIRTTITGKNKSSLAIAFTKDKETVINAEFTAEPLDEEGTLLIYEETIPEVSKKA